MTREAYDPQAIDRNADLLELFATQMREIATAMREMRPPIEEITINHHKMLARAAGSINDWIQAAKSAVIWADRQKQVARGQRSLIATASRMTLFEKDETPVDVVSTRKAAKKAKKR